jgi:hypothetical protein
MSKIRVTVCLLVLVLAACAAGDRDSKPRAAPPTAGRDDGAAACFARLDRIPGLKYRRLPPHSEGECSYDNAVQLLDIGVPVAGLKAVSCPAAEALFSWLHDGVRPAARDHFGADVVRVGTYGSYACRTRNGQAGARLSEHAFANAIDFASFTFADGRVVAVKSGWRGSGDEQSFLRSVHRAGCARFNVVIGPDGDRFHQDHVHLDMGRGPYCR